MSNADNWIIFAGVINALLAVAVVLIFKNWPKKSAKH